MRVLSPPLRLGLALCWLAVLLVAGWWVADRLRVSGDLRKFMPSAQTPAQKLLIDELGEGPGSRLLLIGLSGEHAETLAGQSQAMQTALTRHNSDDALFSFVANGGEASLDAIPGRLRPYRYLLTDRFDAQPLDADTLQQALEERVQDLGSPASVLIEPLLPSDPTLELLHLAQSWQPAHAPQRLHEVWFDRAGREALLLVETRAAGFDPDGQLQAVDAIRNTFDEVRGDSASRLTLTGPGAFSVEIGGRTAAEANRIGMVDTVGLILLLLVAYRNWKQPLFGILPLASAGLAGLAAVALLFDGVHGITIAFGFTLIGVVQDYPIHLFSHQRPGLSPWANARGIWPTLATGVASTCIAYLTFFTSGVEGLHQLSVFTITGLMTAALGTRLLLPALIDPDPRDPAESKRLSRLWSRIERLPRPRWSLLVLALVSVAVLWWAPGPFWQNDLSKLTPVPEAAMAQDTRLRDELGAPDVRYLLAVQGRDADTVLQTSERLQPALERLVQQGAIDGYDLAARYLPSAARQRQRQQALPDAPTLRKALDDALTDSAFRADAFDAFLADVERARTAAPLRAADLEGTPLQSSVDSLLLSGTGHATALVSLSGLDDPQAVAAVARQHGAELLDLKQASESLVAQYRQRVLWALALAAVLLAATVWLALRRPQRVWRVLLPMALTTLLILAVLRGFGVELTLFHLVALVLAAGLGLDYALFFEHAGEDRADQLRTLHALIVCSLMTLLVFFLLALSSIPVLRAIGVTVTLGVLGNFVLSLLVSRHVRTPQPSLQSNEAPST